MWNEDYCCRGRKAFGIWNRVNMNKIISIVGSRETPEDQLAKIQEIAQFFAKKGWILRSGGSWGADEAGLSGYIKANKQENVELYLPWQGILWSQANWDEAAKFHPVWNDLKLNHKIFHARNISIILGLDNQTLADLVVCWTPEGKAVGGSATGIVCAEKNKIKVFNLGSKTGLTRLRKYCKNI